MASSRSQTTRPATAATRLTKSEALIEIDTPRVGENDSPDLEDDPLATPLPYSDEHVGLDTFSVGDESTAELHPEANLWILTIGKYGGRGYTTDKSFAEYCMKKSGYPVQGYKVDTEMSLEEAIEGLDKRSDWLGYLVPERAKGIMTEPETMTKYSDELVGLDKCKVGQESETELHPDANFWIITFKPLEDKEALFTNKRGEINSGRGYTTQRKMAERCVIDFSWSAQGYKIDMDNDLKTLIQKMNNHQEWFGSFWYRGIWRATTSEGMSYNLRGQIDVGKQLIDD